MSGSRMEPPRVNTESEDSVSEAYDELPRPRSVRPEATREFSHRASPLYEIMSRGELEAQSARLISQLRRSMQERARMLSPPTNELVIRQDSSRPSDAGRKEKNRREPSASNLLGQVPVKPGRVLFSDSFSPFQAQNYRAVQCMTSRYPAGVS